jgi:hypothetical protein
MQALRMASQSDVSRNWQEVGHGAQYPANCLPSSVRTVSPATNQIWGFQTGENGLQDTEVTRSSVPSVTAYTSCKFETRIAGLSITSQGFARNALKGYRPEVLQLPDRHCCDAKTRQEAAVTLLVAPPWPTRSMSSARHGKAAQPTRNGPGM